MSRIQFNPAQQRYVGEPQKPKKTKQCLVCGSDREQTKNLVLYTNGQKLPCNSEWHEQTFADTRIGGTSVTPDPLRSRNVPRG